LKCVIYFKNINLYMTCVANVNLGQSVLSCDSSDEIV